MDREKFMDEISLKVDVSMKDVVLSWISQNKKFATNNLKMNKDVFDVLFYLLLEEFIRDANEFELEQMVDNVCLKYQKMQICNVTIDEFKKIILRSKEIAC